MASISGSTSTPGRSIEVDATGVILRHPLDVTSGGVLRHQHAQIKHESGNPVYFKNGPTTIVVADVVLPKTLLAYIDPTNGADVSTYRATLNAVNFDYVSGGGDDDDAIIAGLLALVAADPLYDAEAEGARLAIRSVDDTPFTAAVSVPAGTGALALSEPIKGHANAITSGSSNSEWTEGVARTVLVCAAGESASLKIRYTERTGQPTKAAR